MSTKDLALRIVKDQFGVLAEEICDFVSNRDHPSFPEILQNSRSVFKEKVNDAKISACVLALCLHSILVPLIPSVECRKLISARYTFNAKAALYRLRLGSCIQYIKEEIGEECASIATELSIRGAATIEDVIASVQETFPDTYTRASLSRAADILIMRNLICQKTDISTYARQQNSAILSESISHRPTSRGRGRGRGRGGRGTGRGTGRETGRGTGRVTAEAEEDLTAGKRRARSLGAQIMEMQVKKAKMDEAVRRAKEEVSTEASAVESERSSLLFTLNMEQYTCVMRNEAILRFVGERFNATTAKVMETIFGMVGMTRSASEETSGVFSGQQVYSRLEDKSSITWSLFLRHLKVLCSEQLNCLTVVTVCDSALDATGGEYKVNYKGVIGRIVEDTVAAFIDKRYTYLCSSIFRALLKHKKLEEQQVAMMCLLPEKECRTSLYSLLSERLIRSQEVPRKPDRNTQSTIYLFTADMEYAVNALIDFIYVIILNLRCRQKDVVMKKATLYEVQRRGNLSDQQREQLNRMENGLRCMDMSIVKLDQTLAILRDMY
ncbi:hypothetical protein WA588_000553 [Blastocystis sp. NMH]